MDDRPGSTLSDAIERARALAVRLEHGLVERREVVRLVLLAALAGHHVLLVGPPGTAKSEIARRLVGAFEGARGFERLLTRFSVPEELFGPLSIRALEEDRYERLVDGYLPSAHIVFLDEVFKANSAILNTLLGVLEERIFDNGRQRVPVPLVVAIGASNELPEDRDLQALHDRFLVRVKVDRVSDAAFDRLLALDEERPRPSATLSGDDLAMIRAASSRVALPGLVRGVLGTVRSRLFEKGIVVSDRRFRRIASLLRTAALLDSRDSVGLAELSLVPHCVWDRVEQIEIARAVVGDSVRELLEAEPRRIASVMEAIDAAAVRDAALREPATDEHGRLLFIDEKGDQTVEAFRERARTTGGGDPLYKPPPGFAPGSMLRHEYSFGQLWELHFQNVPFGLAALESFAADPRNAAVERTPRRSVLGPARFVDAEVVQRVAQIDAVSADVEALVRAIDAELVRREPREVPGLFETAESVDVITRARESLDRARVFGSRVRERLVALPRKAR